MQRSRWTREELMLVMNLYTKLRYGQFNYKNKDVLNLANLIGKTPGAVAFKLVHLSRQDPKHKDRVKGLANPGKNAIKMYNDFAHNWDEMLYQSELLLAKYQRKSIEDISLDKDEIEELKSSLSDKKGEDVHRIVKSRVNQALFRKVVLTNYSETCAICGMNIKSMLIASHILKWSKSIPNRLNPENGLCLCNLHDKAFELGYIGINPDYKIKLSSALTEIKNPETYKALFLRHKNKMINLPDKFYPNPEYLEQQLNSTFIV